MATKVNDDYLKRIQELESKKANLEHKVNIASSLEEILSKTSAGLLIFNQDFNIKFINDSLESTIGLKKSDLKNHTVSDFIDNEYFDIVRKRSQLRFSGKDVDERYQIKIKNINGQIMWVDLKASLIKYDDETCVLCTIIDISDRIRSDKEINEKKNNIQSILNNTNYSFFLISRDLEVIEFNKSAKIFVKAEFNENLEENDHILNYIHDDQRDSFLKDFAKVLKGKELTSERKIKVLNGETMWIQSQLIPSRDENGHIN